MKTPRTANAVGHIDDDLITVAAESRKKKKNSWVRWGSLAACFALVVVAAVIALPLPEGTDPDGELGDSVRPYKDVTILSGSADYAWRWEYKTVEEKYTVLDIDGKEFSGRQREIGAALIGEKLGNYKVKGYDTYSEEFFYENFDVYEITGISSDAVVAVLMEGKYYVFFSDEKEPPATLGEVLDLYSLPNTVELKRFSLKEQGEEDQYFNLNNDDYIWQQLSGCRNAEYVDDDKWRESERDYISFTVTSEALGVYKRVMYITEDGYLWTNVFDVAYLYDIGKDATAKIIDYVLGNATPGEFLPYMYSLAGTITEIGDGYILLDDSVMCVDPEDGIVYRIITTDHKLSRIFAAEWLEVGDTVQVQYVDFVDLKPNAVVDSAVTVFKVMIVDESALTQDTAGQDVTTVGSTAKTTTTVPLALMG